MNDTTTVTASRDIPASAKDIFDLLSNPERHSETDSSGMVRSLDQGQRIKAVGDTFRMNMTKEDGDYQTDNTVFAFVPDRAIGWKNERNITADVEVGAKWLWELEPVDANNTTVTLTYDIADISDPKIIAMAKENFTADALEGSLATLAEAVA